MRRAGYFATLSGERAAAAGSLLRPPRRLHAHEPVSFDAPSPETRGEARQPESPPSVQPHAEAPTPRADRPIARPTLDPPLSQPKEPDPLPLLVEATPPVAQRVELHARDEPIAAQPRPRAVEPRSQSVRRDSRVTRAPVLHPSRGRDEHAETTHTRPATWARPAEPRRRAPELRIGAIEVTVVPPPSPAPPQARPARALVASAPPRPARGPDQPAPWFGLAQR